MDSEMFFEVVFVFKSFPTLYTFELPVVHSLIESDASLGWWDIITIRVHKTHIFQ